MRRATLVLTGCLVLVASLATLNSIKAQNTRKKQVRNRGKDTSGGLPNDERLLKLHRDFVLNAQKLAAEYERKKDYEKAKVVYGEILKLTPKYRVVREKLDALIEREATARKATFTVAADKGWQNTGIKVIKGKPVKIRASGSWTFTLTARLSPDGMAIPKELQKFKLGSLLGVIQPTERSATTPSKKGRRKSEGPKPFSIGSETSFVADETGVLFVSMYDNMHDDNRGVLKIEVQGTFERQ